MKTKWEKSKHIVVQEGVGVDGKEENEIFAVVPLRFMNSRKRTADRLRRLRKEILLRKGLPQLTLGPRYFQDFK